MATFFMFGKYSGEAIKSISAKRTEEAKKAIAGLGGSVTSIHALLGKHDVVLIVDLPGVAEAMKASIALNALTGISFRTTPAVPVEDFDALAGK